MSVLGRYHNIPCHVTVKLNLRATAQLLSRQWAAVHGSACACSPLLAVYRPSRRTARTYYDMFCRTHLGLTYDESYLRIRAARRQTPLAAAFGSKSPFAAGSQY